MRIHCPLCGARDRREFSYKGAALVRPLATAESEAWHTYVHLRENPAGPLAELWYHEMGCGSWLQVTRDTVNHTVSEVVLARDAALGAGV